MKMIFSKECMSINDAKKLIEIETNNSKKYFIVLKELLERLNCFSEIKEKLIFLDYNITLIKESVIAEYVALATLPYYCNATDDYIIRLHSCIMTFSSYNSYDGIVNSYKKSILTTAVKPKSIVEFIKNKKLDNIHQAVFVSELNMIAAYEDGYHRLAAVKYLRESIDIPVRIIDFENQYDHISTNGVYWFDFNGNYKELSSDYRFPLLYTLCKIKSVICGSSCRQILDFDGIHYSNDNTIAYDPEPLITFSKDHNIKLSLSTINSKAIYNKAKTTLLKIKEK